MSNIQTGRELTTTEISLINGLNSLAISSSNQFIQKTGASTFSNATPASSGGGTVGPGTVNEIAYFDTANTVASLTVATYPSLVELSYVKGVSSSIQNQINSKGVGTVTAIGVTTANGVSGSSSGGATPNLTITLGAITPTSIGSATIATTQSPADNSTKLATTAYVDNAVSTVPGKDFVKYASVAALPSIVYANGASGVGATLTGVALAAISLDGASPGVGDRVLIKNQVSSFQNGIYVVTQTGSGIAVFILTRAIDFDQSSDIQLGASTTVSSGNTLAGSTWEVNSASNPVMGTDAITFIQIPSDLSVGNTIILNGTTTRVLYNNAGVLGEYAISGTGSVAMTNSPTFVTPALGTPASGVATNLTSIPAANLLIASQATGDILYASSATVWSRLPKGSDTQVLTLAGGIPSWAAPSAGTVRWDQINSPTSALSLTMPAGDETTFTIQSTTSIGAFLWTSSTITTGSLLKVALTGSSAAATTGSAGSLFTLSSTTTGYTGATQRIGAIYSTGANTNASVVLQGLDISVSNTGTTNTNWALRLSASGGSTTNVALDLVAGEFRIAGSAGTSGQLLQSGGANASPIWVTAAGVPTITTYVPYSVMPIVENTTTLGLNVNTTGTTGLVSIPFAIVVNQIAIDVSVVNTAGTIKIGLYTSDGQTQKIAVTSGTINATGIATIVVGSVSISPGIYYWLIVPVSTTDISIKGFGTLNASGNNIGSAGSKNIIEGTQTVTAGTLPATFGVTSATITATGRKTAIIRMDN